MSDMYQLRAFVSDAAYGDPDVRPIMERMIERRLAGQLPFDADIVIDWEPCWFGMDKGMQLIATAYVEAPESPQGLDNPTP